jgi:hypothetical protein
LPATGCHVALVSKRRLPRAAVAGVLVRNDRDHSLLLRLNFLRAHSQQSNIAHFARARDIIRLDNTVIQSVRFEVKDCLGLLRKHPLMF